MSLRFRDNQVVCEDGAILTSREVFHYVYDMISIAEDFFGRRFPTKATVAGHGFGCMSNVLYGKIVQSNPNKISEISIRSIEKSRKIAGMAIPRPDAVELVIGDANKVGFLGELVLWDVFNNATAIIPKFENGLPRLLVANVIGSESLRDVVVSCLNHYEHVSVFGGFYSERIDTAFGIKGGLHAYTRDNAFVCASSDPIRSNKKQARLCKGFDQILCYDGGKAWAIPYSIGGVNLK